MEEDKLFDNIEDKLSSSSDDNTGVSHLLKSKDIKLKSDLTETQINLLTKLFSISKLADIPELDAIGLEFIKLRVSKQRKGRAEVVDALKQTIQQMNPFQQR